MAKKQRENPTNPLIEKGRLSPGGYLDDYNFITPGLRRDDEPYQRRLPTLVEMGNLSNGELLRTLNHYGITEHYGILQTQDMDYVRRMMPMRSEGDINRAYQDLLRNQERHLLGVTRRVAERWSTLDAIQGDINKEMIWIAEDDEATCENCAPRSGEIDTWIGWKERGFPGAETCQGGNLCRCDLTVID